MQPYNTKVGIQGYLNKGLPGLHQLIKDRQAAFDRAELVEEFVVLGHWWLLSGNLPGFTQFEPECLPEKIEQKVPIVLTMREFREDTLGLGRTKELRTINALESVIPPANTKCCQCHNTWVLENSFDCRVVETYESHKLFRYIGQTFETAIAQLVTKLDYGQNRTSYVRAICSKRFIDLTPKPLRLPKGSSRPQNKDGLLESYFTKDWEKSLKLPVQHGDEVHLSVSTYFLPKCREEFLRQNREQKFRNIFLRARISVFQLRSPNEISVVIDTVDGYIELFEQVPFDMPGSYLIAAHKTQTPKLYEKIMAACEEAEETGNELTLTTLMQNPDLVTASFDQLIPALQQIYKELLAT